MICTLPWNPLAWWAKGRLGQLAELACDDWVLASGMAGTDYAASLLELLPQRGTSPALAAVSSQSGLIGRVQHILRDHHVSPAIGKSFASLALFATAVAASVPGLSPGGFAAGTPMPALASPTASELPAVKPTSPEHTIQVSVKSRDGKPVSSALVLGWQWKPAPRTLRVASRRSRPQA